MADDASTSRDAIKQSRRAERQHSVRDDIDDIVPSRRRDRTAGSSVSGSVDGGHNRTRSSERLGTTFSSSSSRATLEGATDRLSAIERRRQLRREEDQVC